MDLAQEKAVLDVVLGIPKGAAASYGQVAALAGLPGRARLVGRVLRTTNAVVPWHRVVRSDGSTAVTTQLALLRAEGAPISGQRVVLEQVHWRAIDALLFAPD